MPMHAPYPRGTLAMLVALAALAGCGKESAAPESVRPVLTQTVQFALTAATAVFPGEVRARHESDLAFRIGGKIVSREVDVGAAVRKGQTLARLDPSDVALAVRTAEAQLAAAETDFGYAEAELKRSQSLLEQRFISQAAVDGKRNAFNVAKARLEQARSQRAVAANQMVYATLAADRDGIITAVNAEPGQVVAAGQTVARLARPDEKEAWISVPESRLAELRDAPELAANLWAAPARLYAAKVREIAPSADAVTRSFQVKVSLPDADSDVRLGMTANVMVKRSGAGATAKLPLPALASREGKPVVWVVSDQGEAQPRAVEVAGYQQDGVIIAAGLREGEKVVVAGAHKLLAGQKVDPRPSPLAVTPPR